MRSRCRDSIILLLVILFVNLGTCLAGSPGCPPGCPDCERVPACCAEMAENLESGNGGTDTHSPNRNGCTHDGICFDDLQSVDVVAVGVTINYDSSDVPSRFNSVVPLNLLIKAAVPILLKAPSEKVPPLYLKNCSFLI